MAKVGLKDTLTLLAKGYTKKDIDALAAVDEEQEQDPASEEKIIKVVPVETEETESAKHDNQEIEDLKKQLEDTQEKLKAAEEKTKKLQQDNIHEDSSPAAEEALKEQQESLTNLVRGFM